MDALDIRILRSMGIYPFAGAPQGSDALTATRIARELKVTPETVRDRLARMESAGVIAGYEIVPNLRHLGLDAAAYFFELPNERARAALAEVASTTEGVLEVSYFVGPQVCVDLTFRATPDLEAKLGIIGKAAGADPEPFYGWNLPPVSRPLTNLDWRILRALRGRARTPLPQIAKELGVGYRTVKRHFDRMATERSFFVTPVLDPSRDPGLVPFALLVFFERGAPVDSAGQVVKNLDDRLVFYSYPLSTKFGNLDLLAFADSVEAVDRLRKRVAALPHVHRVEVLLRAGSDDHTKWIDRAIEERLKASTVGA